MESKNLLLRKQNRTTPEPHAAPEEIEAFVKQGIVTPSIAASQTYQPTNLPKESTSQPPEKVEPSFVSPNLPDLPKKERWVVTGYKLRESTQDLVNRLSRITGKSKGEIVDEALRDYLAKVRQQGPLVLEL